MNERCEQVIDFISGREKNYHDLTSGCSCSDKKEKVMEFLRKKVRIKIDTEISRGILIAIGALVIILIIAMIKSGRK